VADPGIPVKKDAIPVFLAVPESKFSPVGGSCQDVGEKFPLAFAFHQGK